MKWFVSPQINPLLFCKHLSSQTHLGGFLDSSMYPKQELSDMDLVALRHISTEPRRDPVTEISTTGEARLLSSDSMMNDNSGSGFFTTTFSKPLFLGVITK